MSLANDNFCFHYLRHPPPPPRVFTFFKHRPFYFHFFLGGGENSQFLISPPSNKFLWTLPYKITKSLTPPPSLPPRSYFVLKTFFVSLICCLELYCLLIFLSFLSFLVILITIRSPTHAVLCCLVTQRSSIPTQLPPTASSSTWTKLSIGTASMYGKWKLFCLTASLQIKTSNFKSTCGRNPHGTGHRHPT